MNNNDITLKLNLNPEEFNFIYSALSELPTKTGAWPLLVKLKQQAESQMSLGGSSN